jgi:hypothetical protein
MYYPLNMKNQDGGHAVANTEQEHIALTGIGYEPRHEATKETPEHPAPRNPGLPRKE